VFRIVTDRKDAGDTFIPPWLFVPLLGGAWWHGTHNKPAERPPDPPKPAAHAQALVSSTIENGGFEMDVDGDGVPDAWVVSGSSAALDNASVHAGAWSLRMEGEPEVIASHLLPANQAKRITVAFWARSADVQGGTFSVILRTVDEKQEDHEQVKTPTVSGEAEWQQLQEEFRVPEKEQAVSIELVLGSGTIWLDDVQVNAVRN